MKTASYASSEARGRDVRSPQRASGAAGSYLGTRVAHAPRKRANSSPPRRIRTSRTCSPALRSRVGVPWPSVALRIVSATFGRLGCNRVVYVARVRVSADTSEWAKLLVHGGAARHRMSSTWRADDAHGQGRLLTRRAAAQLQPADAAP